MKKVLFVTYKMSDGGAERAISVLSQQFIKLGIQVGIFIYKRTENEYFIDPAIEIFTLDDGYSQVKGGSLKRSAYRIKQIKHCVRTFKPDCCIPFLDSMVVETYFAARKLNVAVIATVRNNPAEGQYLRKKLRDFVFARCAAIYLQTEAQGRYFSKKIQNKSFVVPNAVNGDLLKIEPRIRKDVQLKNIVTCGRLNKQKNHELLINAVMATHVKYPEITLSIYGNGEEKEHLQSIIDSNKANAYIKLAGRTDDVGAVLNGADIFVLSSDFEGMPNALIEAMVLAVPCISTDCHTGPKELIGSNERGVLVPVNDTDALANAIIYLLNNTDDAYQKGIAARNYISTYLAPETVALKLIENIDTRVSIK